MNCPQWDYRQHPNRIAHLQAVEQELVDAIQDGIDQLAHCCDTRAIHQRLFRPLTPPGHPYYAGNYRGAHKYLCLRNAETMIAGGKGAPPRIVQMEMTAYASRLRRAVSDLDAAIANGLDRSQQIRQAVTIATFAFVRLQALHPYWDGNGHIGRYVVMGLLGRYRIFVTSDWTIDSRPPYDALIAEYRAGRPEPLEQFVLARLVDPAAPVPPPSA